GQVLVVERLEAQLGVEGARLLVVADEQDGAADAIDHRGIVTRRRSRVVSRNPRRHEPAAGAGTPEAARRKRDAGSGTPEADGGRATSRPPARHEPAPTPARCKRGRRKR